MLWALCLEQRVPLYVAGSVRSVSVHSVSKGDSPRNLVAVEIVIKNAEQNLADTISTHRDLLQNFDAVERNPGPAARAWVQNLQLCRPAKVRETHGHGTCLDP